MKKTKFWTIRKNTKLGEFNEPTKKEGEVGRESKERKNK